ncbi:MAG: hypothetical protein M3Y80_11685 [Verrucomicrobiota bacterium]|nr:hypothetical protein [Verrucomicrobiota bacterium]
MDVKMTSSSEINDPGPATDGVDHNHDLIYLWLHPTLQVKLFPGADGHVKSVSWGFLNEGPTTLTYLYAGWLKNPSQMPPGETQLLQANGITPQDYLEILKADPYARSQPVLSSQNNLVPDPKRYQSLNTTFPYEPPYSRNDPVPTFKFTTAYTNNSIVSNSYQHDVEVGFSAQVGLGFLGLLNATVRTAGSWTWTNTDTRSSSTGTLSSATVTVGGPAFGYTGPTEMAVYYDVLYRTFLILPVRTAPPSMTGAVRLKNGKAAAGQEVLVMTNGARYRTFTNARGEYRVHGDLTGRVQLQVGEITRTLSHLPSDRKAALIVLK